MDTITRLPRENPWFEETIPVARLQGSPAQAGRALEEEWLPLLRTGPRHLVVVLDGLEGAGGGLLAALGEVLAQVRRLGGQLALAGERSDLPQVLREWAFRATVPVLPDAYSAVLCICDRREADLASGRLNVAPTRITAAAGSPPRCRPDLERVEDDEDVTMVSSGLRSRP
jgi:hypothetical protein